MGIGYTEDIFLVTKNKLKLQAAFIGVQAVQTF